MAPIADLPILEVLSARHIVADLTLSLGTVAHDYIVPGTAPGAASRTA